MSWLQTDTHNLASYWSLAYSWYIVKFYVNLRYSGENGRRISDPDFNLDIWHGLLLDHFPLEIWNHVTPHRLWVVLRIKLLWVLFIISINISKMYYMKCKSGVYFSVYHSMTHHFMLCFTFVPAYFTRWVMTDCCTQMLFESFPFVRLIALSFIV